MASTTPTTDLTTSPQRPSRGRGRGRGGRQSGPRNAGDSGENHSSGGRGRGGPREGRGRGPRGGRQSNGRNANEQTPSDEASLQNKIAGLTVSRETLQAKGKELQAEEEDEGEVCFICANPVQHYSIAPCNHQSCHICSLRLRALYKNKHCAHCRTLAESVIFTDDSEKKYQDFNDADFSRKDDNLGIQYEKDEIFQDTVLLLRFNCPEPTCDIACLGWPALHRHVKNIHHKLMCDLCTRNKKVFTHEHELFTPAELRKHEKFGDDTPGAVDQSGFKGHPECGFCRQRFYGDDELFSHCREKHERCHICDRRNDGKQHQYYLDYDALEVHFRQDHFACPDEECLAKKFVVFESQMDLKAHQLEAHPNGLSKAAKHDARRVDMSEFSYRQQHEQERPRRGRGRGRDPNTEPLPASSAQPLRRDELAYQRQMAIQSAQSVSTRTFGGQLTQPAPPAETYAARAPPTSSAPATVTATSRTSGPARSAAAFPALGRAPSNPPASTSGLSSPTSQQPSASLTPQDLARQTRHAAVTSRASTLLKNDSTKLTEFRNRISSYSKSAISATELIDSFFTLFDTTSVELGKLIKELAEIYEIPSKKDNLLKAWSDWKAINEDYPSLPGPAGRPAGLDSGATTSGGTRVLKLKSSTARRASGQASAGWSSTGFPPLAAPNASSSSRGPAIRAGATPWVSAGTPASASASNSQRPSPASSRPSSTAPGAGPTRKPPATSSAELFPALPAAPKPTTSFFVPGGTGRGVIRVTGGPSTANPWGGGGSASSAGAGGSNNASETDSMTATGGKKGNKNKKQTLMKFG